MLITIPPFDKVAGRASLLILSETLVILAYTILSHSKYCRKLRQVVSSAWQLVDLQGIIKEDNLGHDGTVLVLIAKFSPSPTDVKYFCTSSTQVITKNTFVKMEPSPTDSLSVVSHHFATCFKIRLPGATALDPHSLQTCNKMELVLLSGGKIIHPQVNSDFAERRFHQDSPEAKKSRLKQFQCHGLPQVRHMSVRLFRGGTLQRFVTGAPIPGADWQSSKFCVAMPLLSTGKPRVCKPQPTLVCA
ncbi:hypothetical protein OS493_038705 [Desmophyllum pertusum]|uniref:Uncharacterized protein n=1 Tax=Desmophyllum pertusum TaxID=174260 RepID=A0A9W9ZV49_9CNID|nr:hypothetical protein OS493_038705 [Desmophyllum pertusum]